MSSPFHLLIDQVNSDAEYAWSVHCNLAVPIMDSVRCTHEQANKAAARIMHQWFGLDITKHEHWKPLETQWALDKAEEARVEAICVAELN